MQFSSCFASILIALIVWAMVLSPRLGSSLGRGGCWTRFRQGVVGRIGRNTQWARRCSWPD